MDPIRDAYEETTKIVSWEDYLENRNKSSRENGFKDAYEEYEHNLNESREKIKWVHLLQFNIKTHLPIFVDEYLLTNIFYNPIMKPWERLSHGSFAISQKIPLKNRWLIRFTMLKY